MVFMSLDKTFYNLFFILLALIFFSYSQPAFSNSVWWISSEVNLKASNSTLSKAFLLLIGGALILALSSFLEMTDIPGTLSALHDATVAKALYIKSRDAFRSNPKAMKELKHWKARDIDYDYPTM